MKKFLFLIALFTLMGGANSYAKQDVVSSTGFSDVNGNCSYSEGAFNWTQNSYNTARAISFPAGTLSKYKKIGFTSSNLSDGGAYRIIVKFEGSADTYQYEFNEAGVKEILITDLFKQYESGTKITPEQIATVNEIRFGGVNPSGSVEIDPTSIYIVSDEYECMEISTTIDEDATVNSPFQWYTSSDGTSKVEATGNLGACQFNTAGIKEIFSKATSNLGYGNGFMDVTGYDNITVNIATYDVARNNQVRLLVVTGPNSTSNYDVDVPGAGASTKSLSGLTNRWIAGIWTQTYQNNSQAINSFVFTKDFNATSATAFAIAASTSSTISYDRAFAADQASTVCFPFALTQGECDAAGVFYELTDFDGTTLTFTEVTSGGTTAYKPYLFKATATGAPFSDLTARAITASSEATTSYTTADNNGYTATMTGTLAKQSVNGKYGWNSVGGAFSKATSDEVTIDAFRAYITLSGVSLARVAARFVGDNVTGINEVSETQNVLNPDRKYIENNNIIIVKNGVKYNAAGQLLK